MIVNRNRLSVTELIPHAHPQREIDVECGKNTKRKFTSQLSSEYFPTKVKSNFYLLYKLLIYGCEIRNFSKIWTSLFYNNMTEVVERAPKFQRGVSKILFYFIKFRKKNRGSAIIREISYSTTPYTFYN